ncbi:MAG: type II secretion system protein [Candidatus Gastranaerophilales bacterium]
MKTDKNEQKHGDEMLKPSWIIRVRAGVIPLLWRGDREVGVVREAKARLLCRFAPCKDVRIMAKRSAFTLAEVLITLGIIGVVSAMTMPSLISNMQSEALERKQELFDGRLEEAMNQMRFHEKLTGYTSAMDFVETLGEYIKINEVCDNDELTECFPETVTTASQDLSTQDDLATGPDLILGPNEKYYSGDNVSVIFADGVSAIINYKDECDWLDPYDGGANRGEATNCISMVYDLNGKKGKNTLNSDILTLNAQIECAFILSNDTCATTTPVYGTTVGYLTYSECENQKEELGIKYCYYDTDYWAGAVAYCGGVDYMPTMADLAIIASEATGQTVGAYSTVEDVKYDTDILESYGLPDPISSGYGIWSGEELSPTLAYRRAFQSTYTDYNYNTGRSSSVRWVFCVD